MCTLGISESVQKSSSSWSLKCEHEDACYYNRRTMGETDSPITYAETCTELPLEYSYGTDSMGHASLPWHAGRFCVDANCKSCNPSSFMSPPAPVHRTVWQQSHRAHSAGHSFVEAVQHGDFRQYCYASVHGVPPCAGPEPYDYGSCYGGTDGTSHACQFTDVIDIEDFM